MSNTGLMLLLQRRGKKQKKKQPVCTTRVEQQPGFDVGARPFHETQLAKQGTNCEPLSRFSQGPGRAVQNSPPATRPNGSTLPHCSVSDRAPTLKSQLSALPSWPAHVNLASCGRGRLTAAPLMWLSGTSAALKWQHSFTF